MNIVLIGMKHCGKSTVGQALAERIGCPFIDVDPKIEAMHSCEAGEKLSVREILTRHGEAHFHRIEGHVVCELYLQLDRPGKRAVVALGGRTALNETVLGLLKAIGTIVCLEMSPEAMFERIERTGIPPFLDGDDPRASFMRLYAEREPRYRELADVVVDIDGLTVEQSVEKVIAGVEEHTHAR